MKTFLSIVLLALVAASVFLGWRVIDQARELDGLRERLATLEGEDLDERVSNLESARADLGQELARLTAEPLESDDAVKVTGPGEGGAVFETFRGPVSIEDLYFELVDDEFEGLPNSRIDRLEECTDERPEPDEVCGPLPVPGG